MSDRVAARPMVLPPCDTRVCFMSDRDKNQASSLDIGLSEILSRADQGSRNAAGDKSPIRPPTEILSLDSHDVSLEGEFVALAAEKKWGVLVSRAEQNFNHGDDVEARLWWIRGHLGAFSLPVSLLAAPFESLCRQLQGQSVLHTYRNLIVEIAEIMLGRLKEVGDRRQEYSLRVALHHVGLREFAAEGKKEKTFVPTRAHEFTLGEPTPQESSATVAKIEEKTVRGTTLRVIAVVGVFFLVVGGYFIFQAFETGEASLASEDFVIDRPVPTLMRPMVRAREIVGTLGALVYSLQRTNTEQPPTQSTQVAPKVVEKAAVSTSVSKSDQASTPAADSPEPPRKNPHEVVKTDGPVEGAEFRRGVERSGADRARLPDVIPEVDVSPVPGASYPDGSAVLPGVVKSVITRTEVFSSAGYGARVIGRLEAGDKVSVEGQVGRWLRIRSRQGRAGFVYAQDIGELEDFSVQAQR